jgi:methylglutaconyl-CoA hydratase
LDTLLHSLSDRGIATITFNRPERANSYDFAMLDRLADLFGRFGRDPAVRVIVLCGTGKHFSAGAAIGEGGRARVSMGELCTLIDTTPKPTIAVVQGACVGGALAIASCCDVVVASREAFFSIPEVRLGFAPLPLIGFFARAIGHRALRRYLLSGERFSAEEALRIGLVHELCDMHALESTLRTLINQCLLGAPGAIARAKQALRAQAPAALTPDELRDLQANFDALSTSAEAAEGRAAFKEKRKPGWYPPSRED